MAWEVEYEAEGVLPREADKEGPGIEDYFNVFNEVGLWYNNRELYDPIIDVLDKPKFNINEHADYLNTLTPEEKDAAMEADSIKNMHNRVERVRVYNNSLEKIANESPMLPFTP